MSGGHPHGKRMRRALQRLLAGIQPWRPGTIRALRRLGHVVGEPGALRITDQGIERAQVKKLGGSK